MIWRIEVSASAEKQLAKLDRPIAQRILSFLRERVAKLDDPRSIGEALKGNELGEFWKYRVGDSNSTDLSAIMDNELVQDDDEPASVTLASNPSLSEKEQAKLARTGLPSVREALAGNANLAEKQQRYLATTGSVQVKCQLAKNTSIVKAVQALLADDEEMNVRAALASNPALDEACQITLMDHPDNDRTRLGPWNPVVVLAANAALADDLMQAHLAEDRDEDVQNKLAGNPSLTVAQQAQLASTGNVDIRLGLMDNPVLDERIKRRIIASFTENDSRGAENEVKCASDRLDRFSLEDIAAQKKSFDAFMMIDIPFFNSAAKKEQLEAEANRTSEQCMKATSEYFSLCNKLAKIKKLISLQSALPGA